MSLIPFPSNGDKAPETMGTHDNKPPSACSALDSPPLGSASLPLLTHSGGSRLVSQVSASCSIRVCAHLTVDQSRRVRFRRRTHSVSKPHDIRLSFLSISLCGEKKIICRALFRLSLTLAECRDRRGPRWCGPAVSTRTK